ncbi:MAG TPA: hypothetical protein VFR85_11785 [Anaeromyxobacteraceae bacterium]|nr:hypothetical protein [Anaeromyxobacteraceae bacterium]
MKVAEHPLVDARDAELAGGCLLCGGVLSIRVRPGTVRSVCRSCGWFSSPELQRGANGVHFHHPAGGTA